MSRKSYSRSSGVTSRFRGRLAYVEPSEALTKLPEVVEQRFGADLVENRERLLVGYAPERIVEFPQQPIGRLYEPD